MNAAQWRRFWLLGSALPLLWTGCQTTAPAPRASLVELEPLPVIAGPTVKSSVEIPLQLIGGLVVVETRGPDGPWHFLIDTGASSTLVSPEYAIRHLSRFKEKDPPTVWLRDATGRAVPVESVILDQIDFGPANFRNVRALVFDCGEISDHLGLQIDGVLGFSLFSNARLTLDYPGQRVVLTSLKSPEPLRGSVLPISIHNDVPLVSLAIGTRSVVALIDSGSDGGLNLDPAGLDLEFATPPREGTLIGTLNGNHRQILARLRDPLTIGTTQVLRPIADLSGLETSIGGEILQHFEVTFDQSRREVAFYRPPTEPAVATPPKRSSGLSFNKSRAYWKINAVAPGSPAEKAGFAVGDLISRLNGEPVERWDLNRYRALVAAGGPITYTLIKGRDEVPLTADTFELVP